MLVSLSTSNNFRIAVVLFLRDVRLELRSDPNNIQGSFSLNLFLLHSSHSFGLFGPNSDYSTFESFSSSSKWKSRGGAVAVPPGHGDQN